MKVVLPSQLPNLALTLGVALLLGACAAAPTVPQTAEEAVAALEAAPTTLASGEGDERVDCRSEVVTGTNFKRRTCRTIAEWNARSQLQRRVVEDRANNERSQAGVDSANSVSGTNAVGL